MKNIGKKICVSMLSLSMIASNIANSFHKIYAAENDSTIYVDTDQIITKNFEGFGVQWDPSDLYTYTDEQWASFVEKASFLKPNMMRVMIHDADSYCIGFDENNNPIYDWDSVFMQRLYKILDFAEDQEIPIMIGEWNSPKDRGNLSFDEYGKNLEWDSEEWSHMIVDVLEYLIENKGYTCIRYYNMLNEPQYRGGHSSETLDRWERAIRQLRKTMDESSNEFVRNIKIVGPDVYDNWDPWLDKTTKNLQDSIDLHEIHWYAPNEDVYSGKVERELTRLREKIEKQDPEGKEKGFALGEMGVISGRTNGDQQLRGRDYQYGVEVFDMSIQAMRAGLKFGSGWGFEDSMHIQTNDVVNIDGGKRFGPNAETEEGRQYKVHTPTGDVRIDNNVKIWGFWNELGEEMAAQNKAAGYEELNNVRASDEQLRPWYYTWSMLCRYFPEGSQVLSVTNSEVDRLRASAAMLPKGNHKADLSIAVVNSGNKEQKVTLNVPNANGTTTLNQYFYFDGDRPMNNKGQLEVYDTLENVDLSKGLEVTMPANSCMIFTTLGHNQESHPMTLTTGMIPAPIAVDIYEEKQSQRLMVGQTYQMVARFTPDIAKAEMGWKVTDYFGNESDIAIINEKGQLTINKPGQFKVVGYLKDNSKISDTIDMIASLTTITVDDLSNLDVGTYTNVARDGNPGNFNNLLTIKRNDENQKGIIEYHVDKDIFNFEFKAFSLKENLKDSSNFIVEGSSDGNTWESIECDFKQQAKLNSNWIPYIIAPKNIDVSKNYTYLRISMDSQNGYDVYDPQYAGGTIYSGVQSASEIKIENKEKFVCVGNTLRFNTNVLPEVASQEIIYNVLEKDGKDTTKATIDENGLLTAKETGEVVVVVETIDHSLVTYYPLQIVGGYFMDDINNFDYMYDYGKFTYEDKPNNFGEEALIKRKDNTPQSIVYAFNGIQEASFETFSNATFGNEQASIYMSKDGIRYDLVDSTITKIGVAPNANDFSKYKVTAVVDTHEYNFVKFEIKNDASVYNPMIAKAEIIYNKPSNDTQNLHVLGNGVTVGVGNSVLMNVRVAPYGSTTPLRYESLNPEIATVDEKGLITGISVGSAMIRVSLNETVFIEVPVNVLLENYALNKNIETSSSKDGAGDLAVDGDYSTRWGSDYSDDQYIIVDLGEVQTIDTVKIFWEQSRAVNYDLEVAGEDKQFKVIKEMRNITGTTEDIIQIDPVEARYVKMNGKNRSNSWGYSIFEIEVYNNSQIINVENVDFVTNIQELYVGQEVELEVNINPTNATYILPIYSSSNENVVKVINGKMLAVKAGHAIITADVDGKKATLEVDVVDVNEYKIANELTALSIKNGKVQLPVFDGYTLSIASSSHEKVIQLDGTVNTPVYDTAVDIVVNVSKNTRSNNKVLTKPITLNIVGDDALLNVLETKIEDAKELDETLYKPSTYAKMNQTLLEVKKVFNVQNLLVKEVKDALNKLDNAIQSLELKEDRTTLNKQLKIYKELDEKLYTKASYQKMMSIIREIESSINDDSSQNDIESAIKKLNTISSILIKQTDYDMVKNKIEELEKVNLDMYTTQSVKALKKAINTAKAYLNSTTITNQGLFDQYSSVMKIYHQLQLKVNVDVLKALIAKMEKEDLSSYTVKSVKHLKAVISKVKGRLDDALTEKECIEFMQQLQDAYHGLVKTNHPKTSDSVVLGTYIVLGVASILGLFIFKKRKEQEIK